jgi:hypothetical protein
MSYDNQIIHPRIRIAGYNMNSVKLLQSDGACTVAYIANKVEKCGIYENKIIFVAKIFYLLAILPDGYHEAFLKSSLTTYTLFIQ